MTSTCRAGEAPHQWKKVAGLDLGQVVSTIEYNGDGRPDFRKEGGKAPSSGGGTPDLLTNIVEPLGGQASPSKMSPQERQGQIYFIMQVVTSIAVDDGRDREPRRSMNIAADCGTGPSAPSWVSEPSRLHFRTNRGNEEPKVVSTYQQSLPCLGKAVSVDSYDAT